MESDAPISPDFPFESRFIEVKGSRMHYVDEGEGRPIVLLHGNPTSSYLWRNVVPHLVPRGRVVAPDLIGMGRSEKPPIDYRFFDHADYLDGFIEALGLEEIAFVVHDWGSALGFHYARRHEGNVRALAFMEAIVRPARWRDFPAEFELGFKAFRTPFVGWLLISVGNVFVDRLLPQTVIRDLTEEEMERYREPFPTVASRRPVRQWPREIPIDGRPADVDDAVAAYSRWLSKSALPKLLLHFRPGAVLRKDAVEWVEEHFPNLESRALGKGLHFVQEDHPHAIGEAVAEWLARIDGGAAAAPVGAGG